MTATKPERPVVVTDSTTRRQLAETLAWLNADAKAMRRRGYVGTASADYNRQHARINAVLDDWERAPA